MWLLCKVLPTPARWIPTFSTQDCPSEHWNNSLNPAFIFQVKYKEEFQKTKDKYTTVTETVDSERVHNLKHLYSDVSVSTQFFFSSGPLMWGFCFLLFVHSVWRWTSKQGAYQSQCWPSALPELGGDDVFQARAMFSKCSASLGKTPGLINGFPE